MNRKLIIEFEFIDNEDPTATNERCCFAIKQVLMDQLSNFSFEIKKLEVKSQN